MRLIQLNIWGGKLQYQIPDFLEIQKPDIVCMQEVHDLKGPSGAMYVTLDELREQPGFAESRMGAVYSSHYQQREVSFGNAILSNFPVLEDSVHFTHGQYKDNFDLTVDDFNVRNFQHLTLDVQGKILHVINYHGFLVDGSKAGNQETLNHLQIMTDYVKHLDGPVIVCGDFNLEPSSESMQQLSAVLKNLSADLDTTYQSQFNINTQVCDYVFINDQIDVHSFGASEALVSDHKALILDFDI